MKKLQQLSSAFKEFVLEGPSRQKIYDKLKQSSKFSVKKIIGFTVLFYIGGNAYYLSKRSDGFSVKLDLSRNVSRLSGWFASQTIPLAMRKTLFGTFAKTYNVIEQDMVEDMEYYTTFNEFFTRKVKPRVIDQNEDLIVSPADSKVLTISEVKGDSNILVKGINYKMGEFLTGQKEVVLEDDMFKTLKIKSQDSKIYQAIFYLNPGDYHRYHSPVSLLAKRRNHILGYLAPVKESYISTHERVYEGNERVALFGEWKHGQFTQVYVGATNVGSMTLEFDEGMKTNEQIDLTFKGFQRANIREFALIKDQQNIKKTSENRPDLQEFGLEELEAFHIMNKKMILKEPYKQQQRGILVPKGAEIGRFNLGSTVVVFFEAKGDLKWLVKEGDKVRYGQPVCEVIPPPQPPPQVEVAKKKQQKK